MSELPKFDDDEASEPPMEEEVIYSIPFGSHSEPFLTGNERKVIAEFKQELFELSNERLF